MKGTNPGQMDTSISIEELTDVMASLGMSTEDAEQYVGVIEGNLTVASAIDIATYP